MTRRDRFVRGVGGEKRGGRHVGRMRRDRMATAWLAMTVLVCSLVGGFTFDRRGGVAWALAKQTNGMEGRLATTILDIDDLERDSLGRVTFAGWGAQPPRLASAALRDELSTLRQHRDRVNDRRWHDLRHRPFPSLPIADDAPPRMDRGGSDPDRLLPSSRPEPENPR